MNATFRNALRGLLIALLMLPAAAFAAPCAGFTDVDAASGFCKNVEWMKNRGVTLGCTASAYCPGDVVTRAQMAAFLNRLANALVAASLAKADVGLGLLDLDANTVLCQTPTYAVTGAPRSAHGEARFIGGGSSITEIYAVIVESTDGGTTWSAVSPGHGVTAEGGLHRESMSLILPPRDLAVGASYRYGLRVGRIPGSMLTSDVSTWGCKVNVTLDNRNPATPPFDAED